MRVSLGIKMLQYDTPSSWSASVGLWLSTAVWFVLLALGMPTGIGRGFDMLVALLIHMIGSSASIGILALLLLPVHRAIPRVYLGTFLYSLPMTYAIMYYSVDFDAIASLVISMGSVVCGSAAGVLLRLIFDRMSRPRTRLISLVMVCCFAALVGSKLILPVTSGSIPPEDEAAIYSTSAPASDAEELTMIADNPALPGEMAYTTFTYGSGSDKHRPEFAEEVTLHSRSVDASNYIHVWPEWRRIFWGFNESELPLNGRVWMPEGEGPYPLVLIVHGNHTMENFSDDGYAYLGELLASRGMIAVSVDQNFLNYSYWSGIPNDNYKLRTWILLQHIRELGHFNEQPGNPFYGKINMHQIALVGHSRGGQAAAMAADASRWFGEEDALPAPEDYTIQAVAAIAPTDVNVDHKAPYLHDVYYLTIYGGRDADVNTLKGDEQYSRTSFSDPHRFKSALFIESANHSYFNESWGPYDLALPEGVFLNQQDTMPREEQEEVTKLYVSAFLEIVFHDKREYVPMFRDFRAAGDWLPEHSRYFNRFESGAFLPLHDFEHVDSDIIALDGSEITAKGFTVWEVQDVKNKNGVSKGTKGAVLEWEEQAEFTIELSEQYRDKLLEAIEDPSEAVFTFSIMNAEHELESTDSAPSPEPEIIVELEDLDGASVHIPLDDYSHILTMPETQYTVFPLLEDRLRDGKYKNNQTPVFQTVEISIEQLDLEQTDFEPERLERITFYFDEGPSRFVLDDIGFVEEKYL